MRVDILLYALINSVVDKVDISKLLRHLFEKYENLDIDIFLNIFDIACAKEGCIINQKLVLNMLDTHSDSQRMKVI